MPRFSAAQYRPVLGPVQVVPPRAAPDGASPAGAPPGQGLRSGGYMAAIGKQGTPRSAQKSVHAFGGTARAPSAPSGP